MNTLTTTGAGTARAIAQAGKEPDWLESRRMAAWESYQAAPLPDRVLHLWRYTEPEKFLIDKVEPLVPDGAEGRSVDAATASALSDKFTNNDGEQLAGLLVQQN